MRTLQGWRNDSWLILLPRKPILRLDQLQTVAERVRRVKAPHAGERVVGGDRDSCRGQTLPAGFQIAHQERRMGLPHRNEISFDAEMEDRLRSFEPAAAARGERRRLGDLVQAQESAVETARYLFLTRRHRQLHVIETTDRTRRGP